jgi:hypothetical protein
MRVVPGLCRHEDVRCGVRRVVARLPSGRKVISCHLHKLTEEDSVALEELQVQAVEMSCSNRANRRVFRGRRKG